EREDIAAARRFRDPSSESVAKYPDLFLLSGRAPERSRVSTRAAEAHRGKSPRSNRGEEVRDLGGFAIRAPRASRNTRIFSCPPVGPRSGRGFRPEPRRHIAESLPEVTEGRRSAMWEVSRSELRERRETDVDRHNSCVRLSSL